MGVKTSDQGSRLCLEHSIQEEPGMADQSAAVGTGVDSHWERVGLVTARAQWALEVARELGMVKSPMILEVSG